MKTRNTISIILSVSLAFCFGAPISAFADEIASPVPQQQTMSTSTQEAINASSSSNTVTQEDSSSSAASSSSSQNDSALLSNKTTQESTEPSSKAKTTEEITVDKIADPEEGVAYAEGEVIITYKDSKEAAVKAADDANAIEVVPINDATVEAKASASKADEVKVVSEKAPVSDVIATSDGETTVVAQTPNNMSVAQTIEALSVDPDIESVEPNHIMTLFGEDDEEEIDTAEFTTQGLPDDPYAQQNKQWYLSSINCGSAWNYAKCDNKVAVAVLDTGCNTGHSDLSQNIIATYDTTSKGAVRGDGGSNGHGTHVAGIVSARSNNGIGTSGVSYNANLVCIDVFRGNGGFAYDSDIEAAFEWLIDQGNAQKYNVRVINMSLGSTGDTISPKSKLAKYIDKANAEGIVTVCAAGNEGKVEPSYIADYNTCVGVMNLRSTGESGVALASSSTRNDAMDIAAPGSSIYSTASNGSYKSMSGTSMAAPVVSGVLAMEFAANPNLSADEAKNILYQTATNVNIGYGHGEANALEAVRAASGNSSMIADLTNQPSSSNSSYVTRIAGTDSAETAATISANTFASGSDWVVLARSDDFADAMSATGLAGTLDAPILLTDRYGLSAAASNEIKRLGATKCYVIGGTGAMPGDFEGQLRALGMTRVERVNGTESWDTSVACANKINAHGGNAGKHAIVAMSSNFQDALSISSFAYKYGVPIYLETSGSNRALSSAAVNSIKGLSGTIYVVGGNGAIPSSTVEGIFGADRVVRLFGNDGYDTSNQVATYMTDKGLLSADIVCVACGAQAAKGSDALAGASLAGKNGGVMLLVNSNTKMESERLATIEGADSNGTPAFLTAQASSVKKADVLGGAYVAPEDLKGKISSILNQ